MYNGAPYIERTVASILSQTVLPAEIVIVDDGSTDNGPDIVRRMNNPMIRLIPQTNSGVSAARNRGVAEARCEYVAFLDADDTWEPNHVEILTRLIEKYPSCGVFGSSYYICRNDEQPVPAILSDRFTFKGDDGIMDNYFDLVATGVNGPIHSSSFAATKQAMDEIGGFPVDIAAGEDIYTQARLFMACDMAYSKTPSSVYRLSPGEGKPPRLGGKYKPVEKLMDALLHAPNPLHRGGVKRFVSFCHRNRMACAVLGRNYLLAFKEFCAAFRLYPFTKKNFTAFAACLYASFTHKDLHTVNHQIHKK